MLILAPNEIPLKQYPTNSHSYSAELEGWLSDQLKLGYRYTGSLSKIVGKQTFTIHTFAKDTTLESVKVIDSSLAGIMNFPSSETSLAKSATDAFTKLAKEGWIYSGSYFKKISTSNYVFLIFYKHKKGRQKPEE